MLKSEATPGGWGRAAASRFAKSEDEIKADILKALEGKLSIEFQQYSQWQRISVDESSTSQPSSKTLKPKSASSATSSKPETVLSKSTCSSLCLHPWNKKEPPPDLEAESQKNAHILLLKAKITAKKRSVNEYYKLKKTLKAANLSYKDEIKETEGGTHGSVTRLLEKFEKYSSASKVLSQQHINDLEHAREDYEEISNIINKDIHRMEAAVKEVDDQLKHISADLQTLKTYKDKEYPVKALCITKLQSDVHNTSLDHENEESDLERIINGERTQMTSNRVSYAQAIVAEAAHNAYRALASPGLRQTAQNNVVLAHEIEQNKREISKLEQEILILSKEVSELSTLETSHMRQHVFPEAFLTTAKCDPADEIVLDIPVQKFLPI